MTTLGDDVLAAFVRACDEGDLPVAEYLLQALEVMARRDESDEYLERAYLDLAHSFGPSPHH
jgi:hypothetical protein